MPINKAALKAWKPKVHEVGPVPVLDDTAYVREITVRERNEYVEAPLKSAVHGDQVDVAALMARRVRVVGLCLCDSEGNALFDKPEDAEALHPEAVDYLANEIERLNGLTKAAGNEIEGN